MPKSQRPESLPRAPRASHTEKRPRKLILAVHSKTISEYEVDKGSGPASFQSLFRDQRRNPRLSSPPGRRGRRLVYPPAGPFPRVPGAPCCLAVREPRRGAGTGRGRGLGRAGLGGRRASGRASQGGRAALAARLSGTLAAPRAPPFLPAPPGVHLPHRC